MKYFAAAVLAATTSAVNLEWNRPTEHSHSRIVPKTTYSTVYDTSYETQTEDRERQVAKTVFETETETKFRIE